MVLPFVTSISRDVFDAVPPVLKEAAYGVGCTTWEVFRNVVLPFTRVGVIGGFMLGLGRALGETMAVTFVIGNAHHVSASILAPGTTISASIANEFTEAVGDLYTSSLIALGLILFFITFIVLAIARYMLLRCSEADGVMAIVCSPPRIRSTPAAAAATPSPRRLALARHDLRPGLAGPDPRRPAVPRHRRACRLRSSPRTRRRPAPLAAWLNAIVGSLIMTVLAVIIGTPIGILAGTYLAEYGRHDKLSSVVRFINDILLSAPSIVIGLFIYEIMVAPMGHFSG